MMQDKLFVVGIHVSQIKNLIKRAKAMNFIVYVGDRKESLTQNGDIIEDADKIIIVDYENYDDLFKISKNLIENHGLRHIISLNENALINVAKIQERFGLKGNSVAAVENCIDKFRTKELLRNKGILQTEYELCKDINEVEEFALSYNYPIVIKPRSLKGSIGVTKIGNQNDLKSLFQEVKSYAKEESILVENFINGCEISIEAIVHVGKVHIWGLTEKLLFENTFVERGHITPFVHEKYNKEFFKSIVEDVVDALGITCGPLHIEGYITQLGFIIGEVHTRYGGDNITTITELSNECDIHTPILYEMKNMEYKFDEEISPSFHVGVQYLTARAGKIVSINGLEFLEKEDDIVDYHIDCKLGDNVRELKNSYDRVGWFILKNKKRNKLIESIKQSKIEILTINE